MISPCVIGNLELLELLELESFAVHLNDNYIGSITAIIPSMVFSCFLNICLFLQASLRYELCRDHVFGVEFNFLHVRWSFCAVWPPLSRFGDANPGDALDAM